MTSPQRKTMAARRKRLVVISSAVAALSLAGGVAAQFTSSTQSAPQVIGTGTVALALDNVGDTVWTQPISNFAAGDTMERFVDLRNAGSLDLRGISVAQVNDLGDLINEPAGIDITLTDCSVAWNQTTGACTGTSTVVLSSTEVRSWTDKGATVNDRFLNLDAARYANFAASAVSHLKVSTHIDAATPNEDQNKSGSITYTFKGLQRQGNAETSDATIGSGGSTGNNTGGGGNTNPVSIVAPNSYDPYSSGSNGNGVSEYRYGFDYDDPQIEGLTLQHFEATLKNQDGVLLASSNNVTPVNNPADNGFPGYQSGEVVASDVDDSTVTGLEGCVRAVFATGTSDWKCTTVDFTAGPPTDEPVFS